ncbi:hypothetical protein [Aeromonas enteropelogenes]|uniref:hypothetical protein n=1 Tax=Aeromonas enteropelogenes TaxID=29489 RepID=UPI003BA0F9C1
MNFIQEPSSEDPLSQGDIILWRDSSASFEKLGIVVTADCDLARNKHWGRVSVVPVLSIDKYFSDLFIPNQLGILEGKLIEKFKEHIKHAINENGEDPDKSLISSLIGLDALPEEILTKGNGKLQELHEVIRESQDLSKCNDIMKTYEKALRNLNPKASSIDRISSFLNSPPGDCMILPPFSGLESVPHVAYIRMLREIDETNIALKNSDSSTEKGQRIGRLMPEIKYRLTQMLAQVFSDIGLPEEYEDLLKKESKMFIDKAKESKQVILVGES